MRNFAPKFVRTMKIRQILCALEEFAPLALQDGYDNAGLQIGLAEDADASGALLCLDVTEEVIDEAIKLGCNLIVSHHPLLFRPLKSINTDDWIGRCVMKAIKNGIAIYSAHTNLDSAKGGVNYKIAEKLGIQDLQWIDPKGENAGEGVIGYLQHSMDKMEFLEMVKGTFQLKSLRVNEWRGETVRKIALCGGAGAFLMQKAKDLGADAFITGEIGYHRFFGFDDSMLLLELGHYESEQYTLEVLHSVISGLDSAMPVYETKIKTNPIIYL